MTEIEYLEKRGDILYRIALQDNCVLDYALPIDTLDDACDALRSLKNSLADLESEWDHHRLFHFRKEKENDTT